MSVTLSATISPSQRRFTVSTAIADLEPGDLLRVQDELMQFVYFQTPRKPSLLDKAKLVVTRGILETTAASHNSGTAIVRAQVAVVTSGDQTNPGPFAGSGGGVTVEIPPAAPVAVTNIVAPGAAVTDSSATLPGGFIATTSDPGAMGAGSIWVDITDPDAPIWWRRTLANDAWLSNVQVVTVAEAAADATSLVAATAVDGSANVTATANTSGSGSAVAGATVIASGSGLAALAQQSTTYGAGDAAALNKATARGSGQADVSITADSHIGSGPAYAIAKARSDGDEAQSGVQAINGGDEASVLVGVTSGGVPSIVAVGLPSADPHNAGQLYSDGAPSAGVPKALMVSGG